MNANRMAPRCPICGGRSTLVHKRLADTLYESSIIVDAYGCVEPSCGHVFVHPRPSAEQIASAYSHYPTHSINASARPLLSHIYSSLADLAGTVDRLRAQKTELSFMGLRAETLERLLDVGCGPGLFLLRKRDRGWRDSLGIDTDPQAVAAASGAGCQMWRANHSMISSQKAATVPRSSH